MTPTLKAGKRYKTRDGQLTTPLRPNGSGIYIWTAEVGSRQASWDADGFWSGKTDPSPLDLIAPVSETAPERPALDLTKPVMAKGGFRRGEVKACYGDRAWVLFEGDNFPLTYAIDALINVPEPPRVVVGDRVEVEGPSVLKGTLVAVDGDMGWVRCENDRYLSVKLTALHHIEHIPGHADGEKP